MQGPVTLGEAASIVRDVLSLGLAALGSYLAYLAIRLGRQQMELADVMERHRTYEQVQDLVVEVKSYPVEPNPNSYLLGVTVNGKLPLLSFEWSVTIPNSSRKMKVVVLPGSRKVRKNRIDNAGNRSFSGCNTSPLERNQIWMFLEVRVPEPLSEEVGLDWFVTISKYAKSHMGTVMLAPSNGQAASSS